VADFLEGKNEEIVLKLLADNPGKEFNLGEIQNHLTLIESYEQTLWLKVGLVALGKEGVVGMRVVPIAAQSGFREYRWWHKDEQ